MEENSSPLIIPLTGKYASLVTHMEKSLEIPMATSFRTFLVPELIEGRSYLNTILPFKVSYTHLICYALVQVAKNHQKLHSYFIRQSDSSPARVASPLNLGLAVDLLECDGSHFLIVPVIKNASSLTFSSFHAAYEDLVQRAKSGSLKLPDLERVTLTVTNPGTLGTTASVARLMPGQGSILAIGAINTSDNPRGTITLSCTYDHRIIQGSESASLLKDLAELLRNKTFYSDLASDFSSNSSAPVPVKLPSSKDLSSKVHQLFEAYRTSGYLSADLDPLKAPPPLRDSLLPKTYGFSSETLSTIPLSESETNFRASTLEELLPLLQKTYTCHLVVEISHLQSKEERDWLYRSLEESSLQEPLLDKEKLALLERLTNVEVFERHLRRVFLGQKTFSIEGLDILIPLLEALAEKASASSYSSLALGMTHRGRLATLVYLLGLPLESLLAAFQSSSTVSGLPGEDVLYHLGTKGAYHGTSGHSIAIHLLSNPSHLELVDPVLEGYTRGLQESPTGHTATLALPVLIHGDASFSGQGIVSETLNFQNLDGYTTGGTIHLLLNNQIGFTTTPKEARSTYYASDIVKAFDIPIFHCNADDPEACLSALSLAFAYKERYQKDVLIELCGYRRMGHNETDEPSYTNPLLYEAIRSHPSVREIYAKHLQALGLIKDGAELLDRSQATLRAASDLIPLTPPEPALDAPLPPPAASLPLVSVNTLTALNASLLALPATLHLHEKLAPQLERRKDALIIGTIDFGLAESLALGTLLQEGHSVRFTGQDTIRGTFSHRHLCFYDTVSGNPYTPLQNLPNNSRFDLHNSPLSEAAALAFEYGFSLSKKDWLVLWEAQFGDFINNAQSIVDEYLASGENKWGYHSRLTLLLPHGFEGSGPNHSSAKLERFLELFVSNNFRLCNPTTSSQYFHLLRSQAYLSPARPLIIATPKSLLRSVNSFSTVKDLSESSWQPLLQDTYPIEDRSTISTLLICSGKIFFELSTHPKRAFRKDLTVLRLEQIAPFPLQNILEYISSFPSLKQIAFVQEEPKNQGCWNFVQQNLFPSLPKNLTLHYIGRTALSTPAEGNLSLHRVKQQEILEAALTP